MKTVRGGPGTFDLAKRDSTLKAAAFWYQARMPVAGFWSLWAGLDARATMVVDDVGWRRAGASLAHERCWWGEEGGKESTDRVGR